MICKLLKTHERWDYWDNDGTIYKQNKSFFFKEIGPYRPNSRGALEGPV